MGVSSVGQCFPCRNEDLSSISSTHAEDSVGLLDRLLIIPAWDNGDRWITGACYPARLAQMVSFRPGERDLLSKNKVGTH